jgi:hypothetical protein
VSPSSGTPKQLESGLCDTETEHQQSVLMQQANEAPTSSVSPHNAAIQQQIDNLQAEIAHIRQSVMVLNEVSVPPPQYESVNATIGKQK